MSPQPLAGRLLLSEGLKHSTEFYVIEKDISGRGAEERRLVQQQKAGCLPISSRGGFTQGSARSAGRRACPSKAVVIRRHTVSPGTHIDPVFGLAERHVERIVQ